MKIVEEKIVSKTGDPKTCEDRYCVTEDYACVIDGATNVSGQKYNGLTPGQIASIVISETIPSLPPLANINEIIKMINKNMIKYYKDNDIYDFISENPFSRPSAAMVLYSRRRNTIWMVADCQCMIDGELFTNTKAIDDIVANARSLFLEGEIQKGKSVKELLDRDTGFEAITPFIHMQYYMQNLKKENQFSYIAVTGFDFNLNKIKKVKVKPDAEFIVLASDGYPRLKPTLKESEDELRYILKNDPLCFREYKLEKGLVAGNVSFDDRTYLKIKLG